MFVAGDNIIYSASDLAAAARCGYALLRDFDAKLGWGPAVSTADGELLARTAVLGAEHERRRLAQLREEFGGAVTVIGRPAYTVAGLTAAAEATRRAIADGAPVVYQAAMFDGRFVGFADFLVRDGERYRVTDTKLARSARVTALLQLAVYADTLARSGVPVAPEAELLLGDGAVARYRVDELIPVYRLQRAISQQRLDEHYAAGTAVRWEDEPVRASFRCRECAEQLQAADDLLLVAGMRVSQRAKLLDDHASRCPRRWARATVPAAAGRRSRRHGISPTATGYPGQPRSADDRRGCAHSARKTLVWRTPSPWRRQPRICCRSGIRSSCPR